MRGNFVDCSVEPKAKPKTVTDAQGAFDSGVIGFGPEPDAKRWQVCFRKPGFSSYEVLIKTGENAHETNGTWFLNVVMAASE